jgi:F-type H+-transporting ATPase subunit alpha
VVDETQPAERLSGLVARLEALATAGHELELEAALCPRGAVVEVGDGVAQVIGLEAVGSEELVIFDSGACGMAYDLAADRTGVVMLVGADSVCAGEGASPTGELPSLPVGHEVLGRVVDPLGHPLDGRGPPGGRERAVFRAAPELVERAPVRQPLHTGVMAIDAAIPIGRGQRQLIIGDRNVGKTALALDVVAAQRSSGVICVYVVIGQPLSRVLAIRDALAGSGALAHTVVVAAESAEPPGLQYLAPYAGMAVAEHVREHGRDALIVFDDLTKHADAYRELALLMGRPPGREAFPGDIFYIHAELLERATAFADAVGGRSITALPIVETTDSELAAYIPTNLISITDGQIYLDAARFERNERPAIDVGRSVSRIGGAAQPALMRKVAHNLRIDMARAESLETLTRVGLDVDPKTRGAIDKGRLLRALLRQPRFCARSLADQLLALTAVNEGWLEGLAPSKAATEVWRAVEAARSRAPELVAALERGEPMAEDWTPQAQTIFGSIREQAS